MRNLKFVKRIRTRYSWLYNEIQYKSELEQHYNTLKEHLGETERLLESHIPKLQPSHELIIELQIHKLVLTQELERTNTYIGYSKNMIKYYKKISKVYCSIG